MYSIHNTLSVGSKLEPWGFSAGRIYFRLARNHILASKYMQSGSSLNELPRERGTKDIQ